jgi:hypothetical protein
MNKVKGYKHYNIGWIYSGSSPREKSDRVRASNDFVDSYEKYDQDRSRRNSGNSFQPLSFIRSGISSIKDTFSGGNNGMPRRKPLSFMQQNRESQSSSPGFLKYLHSLSTSRQKRFHQLRRGRLINPWTPFWQFLKFGNRRSSRREGYIFDGYGG